MDSSGPFHTSYGAKLLQSASFEEREQAVHLIDALFVGDPDSRRDFTNCFFGASLGQSSRSPAIACGTDTIVDRASTPSVPSGQLSNQLKDNVTKLLNRLHFVFQRVSDKPVARYAHVHIPRHASPK
jgi:hypothetical protein